MWNRRDVLRSLPLGAAYAWAFGCGGPAKIVAPVAAAQVGQVRTWLHDAIARLAAVYPPGGVHALAVARTRTSAAIDVLGTAVARGKRDGVVLTVRDGAGVVREQVTSELTQAGIAAAVRALGGTPRRASIDAGTPPRTPPEPRKISEDELRRRVEAIERGDKALNSRVVYAVAMIDVDDAHVWSISPTHDQEQRLVRIRKSVARAAWNGTRPVVSGAERAWIGGIADFELDPEAVMRATHVALELMTPGTFEEKQRTVVLDPTVAASLVDAGTRALLTSAAARRPEVARRNALGTTVGSTMLTIVDDPGMRAAYGGFQFDDEGEPAMPITLIDAGRAVAVLSDRAGGGKGRGRRPGHVGTIEPSPSHLRIARGTIKADALAGDGVILEGGTGTVVNPSTGRVVVGASRARETKGGKPTGRVFAEVELVGDLRALMQGVTGVSEEVQSVSYRDDVFGEPRWRSVEAPYLRTVGFVRARRGHA